MEEGGDAAATVPDQVLDGKSGVAVGIETEEIEVALGDANSSALITVPGRTDFKYVVMPMRI